MVNLLSWPIFALRALHPMLSSRFLTSSQLSTPASGVAQLDTLRARTAVEENICVISDQRSTLVGHHLFFMNGKYRTVGPDGSVSGPFEGSSLYSIDLSSSFPVETLLTSSFVRNQTIPPDLTPTLENQSMGSYGGALFATNDSILIYGGGTSSLDAVNELASFNATAQSWSPVSLSGGNFQKDARWYGTGVSDAVSGLSFFIGGLNSVGGLLKIDLSDPAHPSWTNQTAQLHPTGAKIPHMIGAGMIYLPIGKSGVLLLMGGQNDNASGYTRPMSHIAVYDINSNSWFNVTATGTPNIPSPRQEFCLGLSRAPDDSSFQVSMYGGLDNGSTFLDDVWVLSVPSFLWIAVNDTNNGERDNNNRQSVSRSGHTCTMWQGVRMIVIGGIFDQPDNGFSSERSPSPIGLLDTSTYSWQTQFFPNTTDYRVPSVVYHVIGGDASGKSTIKSPRRGWADSELSDIFARRLPRVSTESFRLTTTSTQVPSLSSGGLATRTADPKPSGGSSPAQPGRKKTSAIIGGAIGGSSLFLIAITIMLYHLKKHQKRRLEVTQEINPGPDLVIKPWERAELEDHPKHELSGTSKALPELPAENREELSADYNGVEMRHSSPRSWLRFGTPRRPAELPMSHTQETVSAELSTSRNDDELHDDSLHVTHEDQKDCHGK